MENTEQSKETKVIKQYSDVIAELNQNTNNELGRDIKPNEAFGLFVNSVGAAVGKQHFKLFREAFKLSKISDFNDVEWESMYKRYFKSEFKTPNTTNMDKPNFSKLKYLENLNDKEIIILSVIIGTIIGLILSIVFGETQYYSPKGHKVSKKYSDSIVEVFKFNYFLFLCGFIICSGASYLSLSKVKKK